MDFTAAFSETHISYRELIFVRLPLEGTIAASYITGFVVFTIAQEVIESNKNRSLFACMYGDFGIILLEQQSFGTLLSSASGGIGGGLSQRIPSIRLFMGRIYSSSVVFKGQYFPTRWIDVVMANSALATVGTLILTPLS